MDLRAYMGRGDAHGRRPVRFRRQAPTTTTETRQARATIGLYRSQLATCEAANAWPGYSLSEVPFEVEESLDDPDDGEEFAADAGPFDDATWAGIGDDAQPTT